MKGRINRQPMSTDGSLDGPVRLPGVVDQLLLHTDFFFFIAWCENKLHEAAGHSEVELWPKSMTIDSTKRHGQLKKRQIKALICCTK